MANQEQLNILKQGADAWNAWRMEDWREVDLSGADLSSANLFSANLSSANLSSANLSSANLSSANLSGANLSSANLSDAILSEARLFKANLPRANLSRANLSDAILSEARLFKAKLPRANLFGANLSIANLCNTDLTDTDLSSANFYSTDVKDTIFDNSWMSGTTFNNVDLSVALDLSTIRHFAPSYISIDTLYKSKGRIPEVFLRGCGVPDSFITYIDSLIEAQHGLQFYSCFISYSGKDEAFASRLHSQLQKNHVRVWYAPEDMAGGKKIHEQIEEAIRLHDKLIIVLSPHSLKSEWVMTELRKARKQERATGQRKLFPIGLVDYSTLNDWECPDSATGQDLAEEVRQYFIPDFSQWSNDRAFDTAFTRLLNDLRTSAAAK